MRSRSSRVRLRAALCFSFGRLAPDLLLSLPPSLSPVSHSLSSAALYNTSPFPFAARSLSCRHQLRRLALARRSGCSAANDGEVHGQPEDHPLRRVNEHDHRAHQESVSADESRSAGGGRGESRFCIPFWGGSRWARGWSEARVRRGACALGARLGLRKRDEPQTDCSSLRLVLAQMATVLKHVAKKERFHLPSEVSEKIIAESNGNLRKALLVFEALKMQS
jgi:hypothetical protein